MDRIFDRVCLDRTLLIKEKIECILGDNQDTQGLSDALEAEQTKSLSHQIEANKIERMKTNMVQKDGYQKILQYVASRLQFEKHIDL
jgi:hypothetical protein